MSALKRRRIAMGLSCSALAKEMDVTPAAVFKWESGKWMPQPKRIPKLARVLGIDALSLTKLISPEQPGEVAA